MSPSEIRQLRLSLGLTQKDLAEFLCLRSKSQATHLESGRTPATGAALRLLLLLRDTEGGILSSVQTLENKSRKNENRG